VVVTYYGVANLYFVAMIQACFGWQFTVAIGAPVSILGFIVVGVLVRNMLQKAADTAEETASGKVKECCGALWSAVERCVVGAVENQVAPGTVQAVSPVGAAGTGKEAAGETAAQVRSGSSKVHPEAQA